MLNYMEYLGMPTTIVFVMVCIFLCMQIIGELIEFRGKAVPEVFKIRKYFKRKKKEHTIIANIHNISKEMNGCIDNFKKFDKWSSKVDERFESDDKRLKELGANVDIINTKLDRIEIENKRNTIIDFAVYVANEDKPVTREQFNRIFRLHSEYQDIIEKRDLTNGEIDIAIRIIGESYENHLKNKSFIEDIRGYDLNI